MFVRAAALPTHFLIKVLEEMHNHSSWNVRRSGYDNIFSLLGKC
jgi:hypothetical protein